MFPALALEKRNATFLPQPTHVAARSSATHVLAEEHTAEVLAFLAARPLHTVVLAGFIRDNGLVSPLNRGTFYACRDEQGELEGVALIGHFVLFEARTEAALVACARLAKDCRSAHLMMGEQEKVEQFWAHYSEGGQRPRLICRELLFEQKWPVEVREAVENLRLATPDDLELVMPVQAQMAFEESGVNPMEKDPEGFRRRCARRIEQGRTWVWVEDGRLIFKTEIISETPEVIYIEGIWVSPEARGQGYAERCVSQLVRQFLQRAGAVSILVNEQNETGKRLYNRAGFKMRGLYDTIFLQQEGH
jgi:uncharacterized protein